jgi:hypothetical protein
MASAMASALISIYHPVKKCPLSQVDHAERASTAHLVSDTCRSGSACAKQGLARGIFTDPVNPI